MSKPSKSHNNLESKSKEAGHQTRIWWIVGIVFFALIAVFYFRYMPDQNNNDAEGMRPSATSVVKDTDKPDLGKLMGRWLRPDGGYILEIRSAAPDGKLDVAYYNPKPIHVGRAAWVQKDGKLFVMAELQDVNYPGSTYGLEYLVGQDKLAGTYYQAVEKSTYDVEFVREK